jgi:glycosyltransferase involved in cell wall biosynthesis
MEKQPLVSVIIPAYNSASYVAQAVDIALAQSYAPLEIIVVDDGSSDNTAEVLKPYEERIQFVQQANHGPAHARNTAIRRARGELLAFLDADDQWLPEKLALQVPHFLGNPKVGVVHSDWVVLDMETGQRRPSTRPHHLGVGNCYRRLFDDIYVNTPTAVVRRECLERVGMFDEELRVYEDYDLMIRIARHYEFAYLAQPLLIYRKHPHNTTRNQLNCVVGLWKTITKMVEADPSLWHELGKDAVTRKLSQLSFGAGYFYYDQGDFRAARRCFFESLSWRPSRYAALLWLATCLPRPLVQRLRALKGRWQAGR